MPSDIAAGLTLLHQQQDSVRNSQEPDEVISHSPEPAQVSTASAGLCSFNLHTHLEILNKQASSSLSIGLQSDWGASHELWFVPVRLGPPLTTWRSG